MNLMMHQLQIFLSFTLLFPALVAGSPTFANLKFPAVSTPRCKTDQANIAGLPSILATPSTKLQYVALGVGTQNYTCNSTSGIYASVFALQ